MGEPDLELTLVQHCKSEHQFVRMTGCCERLTSSADAQLLLVTHGGTVGVAIAWWLGCLSE